MSSVPAWKKIGLKVKQTLDEDPLALTTHIESSNLTNKQSKQVKKRQREEIAAQNNITNNSTDDVENKIAKPPKRVKLPKGEKPPPPEKDQLVYLRQFSEDKEAWKFSKQKQNWILRHIRYIPESYNDSLNAYCVGLVGSSKDRLIEDMKKVVQLWNEGAEYAQKILENMREERLKEIEKVEENKGKEEDKKKAKEEAKKAAAEEEKRKEAPDVAYATRARGLVEAMTGERLSLSTVDEETTTAVNPPESTEKSPSKAEENKETQSDKSNIIEENIEVTEYLEDEDFVSDEDAAKVEKKEKKSEKKEKKDKKKKKDKKEKKQKSKEE